MAAVVASASAAGKNPIPPGPGHACRDFDWSGRTTRPALRGGHLLDSGRLDDAIRRHPGDRSEQRIVEGPVDRVDGVGEREVVVLLLRQTVLLEGVGDHTGHLLPKLGLPAVLLVRRFGELAVDGVAHLLHGDVRLDQSEDITFGQSLGPGVSGKHEGTGGNAREEDAPRNRAHGWHGCLQKRNWGGGGPPPPSLKLRRGWSGSISVPPFPRRMHNVSSAAELT
jgi:hypothetical protein